MWERRAQLKNPSSFTYLNYMIPDLNKKKYVSQLQQDFKSRVKLMEIKMGNVDNNAYQLEKKTSKCYGSINFPFSR